MARRRWRTYDFPETQDPITRRQGFVDADWQSSWAAQHGSMASLPARWHALTVRLTYPLPDSLQLACVCLELPQRDQHHWTCGAARLCQLY
jgi:hypothetical protein